MSKRKRHHGSSSSTVHLQAKRQGNSSDSSDSDSSSHDGGGGGGGGGDDGGQDDSNPPPPASYAEAMEREFGAPGGGMDEGDMMGAGGDDEGCPTFVVGPGGVPVPNTDPACADIIKERLRKGFDKTPAKPTNDFIDSIALSLNVTRQLVIFGGLALGVWWLQKER